MKYRHNAKPSTLVAIMKNPYPFTPKSNAKLKAGQFWTIRLSDGHYAAGVVLAIPDKGASDTKTFFAGLLNWTGIGRPTKAALDAFDLKVIEQGKAHIKTITSEGEQIEGEIDLSKFGIEITPEVDSNIYSEYSKVLKGFTVLNKATPTDHEKFKTQSTWGFNSINLKASKLFSKTG